MLRVGGAIRIVDDAAALVGLDGVLVDDPFESGAVAQPVGLNAATAVFFEVLAVAGVEGGGDVALFAPSVADTVRSGGGVDAGGALVRAAVGHRGLSVPICCRRESFDSRRRTVFPNPVWSRHSIDNLGRS